MFTELQPLRDHVVIREDEAPSYAGSIVLPEQAKKKPARGTVLAVGPEVGYEQNEAVQIKVGSTVIYSKYSGTVVRLADKTDVLILPEKDIYAIVNNGKAEVFE